MGRSSVAYDPEKDIWEQKASMHIPRAYSSATVVNGMIYVFGGRNTQETDTVEMYNPQTNDWTFKRKVSFPSSCQSSFYYQGKIYLLGGLRK